MHRLARSATAVAVTIMLFVASASSQDVARKETVHFAQGKSATQLKGSIKGYESVDYLVNARQGQTMTVKQIAGKAYFNVIEPDAGDVAIFVGSSEGSSYQGVLAHGGAYTIRVYQMRSTARRGESASYTIDLAVH